MPAARHPETLVYSCSGCSSAAQLANHLAVRLDRGGHAEMSCIAGVGGRVPSLLRKAKDAAAAQRPILAIDGCALSCVRSTLALHGIEPTVHVQLGQQGVRKAYHADFDAQQAGELLSALTTTVRDLNERHAASQQDRSTSAQTASP